MSDEVAVLESIDRTLRAMLMLQIEEVRMGDRPKGAGSLEGLLFKAGFTVQAEIVTLTGISKSAVSARLKDEGLT